jgi:hypothetical protein
MLKLTNLAVTTIELLTQQECQEVSTVVEDLKDLWIQRHPVVPFYTLGASNYFDIAYNPQLPYYIMAKEYNPILMESLGWLYERLAATLAQQLKAPVGYRETLALPGFHIFLSDKAFEQPKALTHQEWFRHRYDPEFMGNPIHCDTPHLVVNWGTKEGIDFTNPISFTLSIALPKSGAGMYVWDLRLDETIGLSQKELLNLLNSRNKRLYSYKVGSMALHSGLNYHQVAPMQNAQPDDVRITLQGHGLFCQGSWKLYW